MQLQKKILLDQVLTPILRSKNLFLLLLVAIAPYFAMGQSGKALSYIDSLTQVLQQQKPESAAQKETALELKKRLGQSLRVKGKMTQTERDLAWKTLRELEFRKGAYTVLKATLPKDSISNEVLVLEESLQLLQDSLQVLQNSLIAILENENTRATKEQATKTLARIHSPQVVNYLINNEKDLRHGVYNADSEENETYRTAMIALNKEYIDQPKYDDKWLLFPYLFQNLNNLGLMEIGLINGFLNNPREFNEPWLLVDFMQANTTQKSRQNFKELLPYLEYTKEKN